jgi:hypothetical protein
MHSPSLQGMTITTIEEEAVSAFLSVFPTYRQFLVDSDSMVANTAFYGITDVLGKETGVGGGIYKQLLRVISVSKGQIK